MIKKNWQVSTLGFATWSYRKLNEVNKAIESLENSNFIKRYFNKESLAMLKEYRKYIERSIKREEEAWVFKELSKMHSSEIENIVKENKSLSKEINKANEVEYISKKEQLKSKKEEKGINAIINFMYKQEKKKPWRPKGKPRGKKTI